MLVTVTYRCPCGTTWTGWVEQASGNAHDGSYDPGSSDDSLCPNADCGDERIDEWEVVYA